MWNSLGKLIPERLEQLRLRRGVEAEQVLLRWPEVAARILGSGGAEVRAVSVNDGVLTVAVSSGIWASEIRLKTQTLLKELNKPPTTQEVHRIKTRLEESKNPR